MKPNPRISDCNLAKYLNNGSPHSAICLDIALDLRDLRSKIKKIHKERKKTHIAQSDFEELINQLVVTAKKEDVIDKIRYEFEIKG
jgi:hypothetical protein